MACDRCPGRSVAALCVVAHLRCSRLLPRVAAGHLGGAHQPMGRARLHGHWLRGHGTGPALCRDGRHRIAERARGRHRIAARALRRHPRQRIYSPAGAQRARPCERHARAGRGDPLRPGDAAPAAQESHPGLTHVRHCHPVTCLSRLLACNHCGLQAAVTGYQNKNRKRQEMAASERLGLYPAIEPYHQARLKVDSGYEIYFEECGNPSGKQVAIVTGDTGGGCNSTMRRYHDPARYRIILFDQRGCGRSLPHASLEANTTWHLVADMDRLRKHLGIERWQLFGGSWGSTLSLTYAQTHPDRVSELILRGIFLLRREELAWFYEGGCSWMFPEAFEEFRQIIPPEERGDMIAAYYRRLTNPDRNVQIAAARA